MEEMIKREALEKSASQCEVIISKLGESLGDVAGRKCSCK